MYCPGCAPRVYSRLFYIQGLRRACLDPSARTKTASCKNQLFHLCGSTTPGLRTTLICNSPDPPDMNNLFISHSSQDDAFVRDLRAALADHGQDVWIDSRELRGGDPLWPEIQNAIDDASAYAVVV